MNLRCIVLKSNVCFFLAFLLFLPQQESFGQTLSFDTLAFYKHLKTENLLTEQIVFAEKLKIIFAEDQQQKDSLSLDIAAAYYRMKMPDSCAVNLKKISPCPVFSESQRELYFTSLILTKEYSMAEKSIGMLESKKNIVDARVSLSILRREKIYADTCIKEISPGFSDLGNRYSQTPNYSPLLAGAFSAVLPGAGKWYVGYKRQALTAFIANALFAAQAAESYIKAGVASPQFIITAGLFGVFYSGNIWGSALAAKKKKRDYLKELDYEILDHYHTGFSKLSR